MRLIPVSLFLLGWGAATYGVLAIREWDGPWAHSICGPWGCGLTTQSLIAFHGFWLSLLGGGAVRLGIGAPPAARRSIGTYLVLAGVLLLVAIGAWDMWTWLPQTAAASNRYLWQRYLFSVATQSDIPAVQCAIVGFCLFLAGKAKASVRQHAAATEPTLAARIVDQAASADAWPQVYCESCAPGSRSSCSTISSDDGRSPKASPRWA